MKKNINYLIQDLQSDSGNGKLLDYVSDNTSYVSDIIDTLITKYDKIYNNVMKLQFGGDIAGQFSNIQSFYSEAIKFIIEINNELKKVNNESDKSAGQIIDLAQFLNSGISPFDDALFDKFNNLNTSINEIYTTLSKQQDKSKALNANTNALKTYIKAINTVELNKLKPLTTLVVELNKLANKLGNLDKVSDTLANNLAVVLKELVDSLTDAKDTINSAHELQKDRHEQIQRAISNVKSLLDVPLNINVKAESVTQPGGNTGDDTTNNNGNGGSGGLSHGGDPGGGSTGDTSGSSNPGSKRSRR
jgi:methyl-accepting chemotaxis protein